MLRRSQNSAWRSPLRSNCATTPVQYTRPRPDFVPVLATPAASPPWLSLHRGARLNGYVAPVRVTDRKLSRQLRRCLVLAGVTRAELFVMGDATRKAITFHDLRATGITWCAVRGDDPLKVKQRAGHRTFSTTEGYIREAENLADGFGQVFPPLPPSLLVSTKPKNRRRVSASVSAFGSVPIALLAKNKHRSVEAPGIEPCCAI